MLKVCRHSIVLILLLLWVAAGKGYGQNMRIIDSLKSILKDKRGQEQSFVLRELAFEYIDFDNRLAMEYIEEACAIMQKVPVVDSLWFVRVNRTKAQLLRRHERYDEVIALLSQILPTSRRNGYWREHDMMMNTLGLAYFSLGHYDKALVVHLENVRLKETIPGTTDLASSYNNIALIYYKVDDYKKALFYYKKGMAVKTEDFPTAALFYFNVALCYSYQGEGKIALQYANDGLKYCNGQCDSYIMLSAWLDLGLIYYQMHNDSLAEVNAQRAYEAAVEAGNHRFQAEALVCLGRLANDHGDFKAAEKQLRLAVENALRSNMRSVIEGSYFELSRSVKGQGRYREGVEYWNKSMAVKDSISGERMINALLLAQVAFDQEKNNMMLSLQESKTLWQKRQNIFIGIIGFLLVIMIGILYRFFSERKKENKLLETQVHERTAQLEATVRELERNVVARGTWEGKIDRAVRGGQDQLKALANMTGSHTLQTELNTRLNNL